MDWTAASRIERFLDDHPGVRLTVAVGYSSVVGLAWLARRTRNRRVRLLIGDCRSTYFRHAKAEDREEAIAFLERPDVVVQNWYKRHGGPSEAHLKVWIAHDSPRPAALSGSANLTIQGLYHNKELVTGIADAEVDQAVERVEALFADAWDVKGRLLGYITGSDGPRSARRNRAAAVPRASPRRTGTERSRDARGGGNRGQKFRAPVSEPKRHGGNWRGFVGVVVVGFLVWTFCFAGGDDPESGPETTSTRPQATTTTGAAAAATTVATTEATTITTAPAPAPTPAPATAVPTAPSNPGDAVSCADFDDWEEAQAWYDTYVPHYGDVAFIDINNNGVACEKLLPEGITVEEVAATVTTTATASPTAVTEPDDATGLQAIQALLAELRTAVENPSGYDRSDYEHDRRYLCDSPGVDPYTGLRFDPATCDVDHIVAAKEAHESGGHSWDSASRQRFGNDPLNLVAARDCVNRSKGSRDPTEWSRVGSGSCAGAALTDPGRCFWAARTVAVKYRYNLTVDTAERTALRAGLANCPTDIDIEAPPRATPTATPPTTTDSTAAASPTGDCHPAYEPCLPNLAGDALNCGDLTAAQKPVRVKEIGADPYRLDRDKDGTACE